MSQAPLNTVLRNRLLVLAANSEGFSPHDISGFTLKQVGPCAEALVRLGTLYRHKVGGAVARYFATPALLQAFVAGQQSKPAKALASPRTRANWPKDAPMNITAETKFTVAAPPPIGILRSNTHSR